MIPKRSSVCLFRLVCPSLQRKVYRFPLFRRIWQNLPNGISLVVVSMVLDRSARLVKVLLKLREKVQRNLNDFKPSKKATCKILRTAITFIQPIGTVNFSIASCGFRNARSSTATIKTIECTIRAFKFIG